MWKPVYASDMKVNSSDLRGASAIIMQLTVYIKDSVAFNRPQQCF